MTLASFYVLISRVRELNGLRLLQVDRAGLATVAELQPDEYLHAWDNGYDITGRWSPKRVVAAYQEARATSESIKARTKEMWALLFDNIRNHGMEH